MTEASSILEFPEQPNNAGQTNERAAHNGTGARRAASSAGR